ncbi:MAG: LysM peptidoglycan-binding domain-containing protein [Chitinophagales bacterium]
MHKIRIVFTCLLTAAVFAVSAQVSNSQSTISGLNDTDPSVDIMDKLLTDLYSQNPAWRFEEMNYGLYGFAEMDTPKYTHDEYRQRIEKLAGLSSMPYTYNEKVQSFIELYVNKRRQQMSNMLTLSQTYFPMFEQELDKRGMPIELKYLAVIESALNTHAVSKAGATGLWQFMYSTGKLYGLKIDTYVDERRDPVMATDAALEFLQELYGIYGDWFLAIAAYNCGPGNVNKALRKAGGGKQTFWDIYSYLPSETRGYVPAFIGASYAFEFHKEHNLKPAKFGYAYEMVDTVMITKKMHLSDIASYVQMTEDELALYNPALKTKTIPGYPFPYPLRLPMKNVATFFANEQILYADLEKRNEKPVIATVKTSTSSTDTKGTSASTSSATDIDPNAPVNVSYTVKKGDNMGYISDWYDCSVSDIKKWNNLKSTKIVPGQKLKLLVPTSQKDYYASINKMTSKQKQDLTGVETVGQPTEKKEETVSYYTVRPGDTLWSISKKYPANTIEELRELNDISKNETLKAGTKIKVVK